MAGVFDRPMFRAGMGMGGTMEGTGLQYPQPFGYGAGQVDPGILGAVRQRDMQGSQIVQGGNLTKQDVPVLMEQRNAAMQSIKEAQLSNDPNKYATIEELKAQVMEIDKNIDRASKITQVQDKSARDFSGMGPNLTPMGPGEMDIFQRLACVSSVALDHDPKFPRRGLVDVTHG